MVKETVLTSWGPVELGGGAVEVTCPHCGKVNLVAGYFELDARKLNPAGKADDSLYCGFCGRRFMPLPTKEKSDAGS